MFMPFILDINNQKEEKENHKKEHKNSIKIRYLCLMDDFCFCFKRNHEFMNFKSIENYCTFNVL